MESQALEANVGKKIDVEASNVEESVNSSITLDCISDFVLYSSYPQYVTHIPTPRQSPTHSFEHSPSRKPGMVLPLKLSRLPLNQPLTLILMNQTPKTLVRF